MLFIINSIGKFAYVAVVLVERVEVIEAVEEDNRRCDHILRPVIFSKPAKPIFSEPRNTEDIKSLNML